MSLEYPPYPAPSRITQCWVLAPTDGCPCCLRRYTEPHQITVDFRSGGTRAEYECNDCGNVWWTAWSIELFEVAA